LRRVVGQHYQRHAFIEDAFDKLGSAGNGDVIVHQHAVNITNYVLNGHGGSRIINKDETILVIDEVSHRWWTIPTSDRVMRIVSRYQ